MPTISVIVPVYNVEKYLRCCVDSILVQTFTDIEVLLVNDGSTDGSGAICDEYAQLDCRVRVFHKGNGGVSSARNLGLDEATGKWIMFVDSDDKVAPEICERLLEHAAEGCMPICACYKWKDDDLKRGYPEAEKSKYSVNEFMKIRAWLLSPWGRLYEKEIIKKENLRFLENISYGEDRVFNYEYLQFVSEITVINTPFYYYRTLSNSLSQGRYISEFEKVMDVVFEKRLQLAESLVVDTRDFFDLHFRDYFLEINYAFENNMRDDAPGTLWQKIQRNNVILRSEVLKKAYSYRNTWPQYYTRRYIHMLELSYHTGSYFWLWLLSIPGKIKETIGRKK